MHNSIHILVVVSGGDARHVGIVYLVRSKEEEEGGTLGAVIAVGNRARPRLICHKSKRERREKGRLVFVCQGGTHGWSFCGENSTTSCCMYYSRTPPR